MIICEKEMCTGCAACLNVCGKAAISMQKKINGHLYPEIETGVCIECGACQRACPNNRELTFRYPNECYIATAVSVDEAKKSTSSGVTSVLERLIIQKEGVVYACSGEQCTDVKHIRIDKEADIDKLKGSKYVQSYVGDCLRQLKKDLQAGIRVLFVGTPCQVAGVYGYLGKEYDNLFTIDLICHGVPSQQILTDALTEYLPDSTLDDLKVRFRKKEKSKSYYGLFVTDKQGRTLFDSRFPKNEYITGFLTGLYYRESCYSCHYAQERRVSDITVGDYWDRENKVEIPNRAGGLSMLIVNTEKGKQLIESGEGLFYVAKGNYENFVARNGQLEHPMPKNKAYDQFTVDYPQLGFITAARHSLKDEQKRIRINKLLNSIAAFVYAIPGTNYIIRILRRNG